MNKPTVINRGVDEVLRVNGEEYRIDNLSKEKIVELFREHNVRSINIISFDEYEKLKKEFLNIKFDDVSEDAYSIWSQICKSCIVKHAVDSKYLKNEGDGICGVQGCENEADNYIDFICY